MKHLRVILPLVVLLALFITPSSVSAAPTVRVYETWSGTVANYTAVYAGHWVAQTILISTESHTVFSVSLALQRAGNGDPGTLVVGLREVDAWNNPVGEDIVTGTIDSTMVSNSTAHGYSILMTSEEGFSYNTTYALVISAESGDAGNAINVYSGTATPSPYAGGNQLTTIDGGISWTDQSDTDVSFAVIGRPLISVDDVKVFQDLYEDGDFLFTIAYTNLYEPFYPLDDAPSYFTLQLRDTDETTLIAQTTCNAWGYKPGEIYLNADAAAALDAGEPYMVVLTGTLLTETPSANYTLVSADWKGSDLSLLDTWVIGLAKSIEVYYDIDLLAASGSDELLNDQGAVFFMTGMPSLAAIRPDLFEAGTATTEDYEEGTGAFDAVTTWDAEVGSDVATAVEDTATILGVANPQNVAGILWIIGYLGLVAIVVIAGGDASVAALLAIPTILIGTQLRILPFAFIATIGSIAILLLVYRFWWSRTS